MTVLIPEICWMAWIPQPTTRARSRWRVVSMVSSLRMAPGKEGGRGGGGGGKWREGRREEGRRMEEVHARNVHVHHKGRRDGHDHMTTDKLLVCQIYLLILNHSHNPSPDSNPHPHPSPKPTLNPNPTP